MTAKYPRTFSLAPWFKVTGTLSTLLIGTIGFYLGLNADSILLRVSGAAMVAFGIAGLLDVLVSRIVLEQDAIHIVSLVKWRSFARSDFQSATVDGGRVALKKHDGSWVVLPDTGANALSVRNTIHAWITNA